MYPEFILKRLLLKPSDLTGLSEEHCRQKIRLQWINLCMQASSPWDVKEYTSNYQLLMHRYEQPHSIDNYFEHQSLEIPTTAFNLIQRDDIEQSYRNLLKIFLTLEAETEKSSFAQQHAAFLNLAKSLIRNQKKFEQFFGDYLYLNVAALPLSNDIRHQWRLMMIRLFAREYLDDFEYKRALITGHLRPILATDKLLSPIKWIVAMLNSVIMAITITLNHARKTVPELKILFFFLLIYPSVILLFQLPNIAKVLELIACPNTQIVRPVSAYTHLNPLIVGVLLSSLILTLLYATLATALIAKLTLALPYIRLMFSVFFAYMMMKQCIYWFSQSFANGIFFSSIIVGLFGLRASLSHYIHSGSVPPNVSPVHQFFSILNLCAIAIYLSPKPNDVHNQIAMHPLTQDQFEANPIGYNKALLSHSFFNTPKDALAIEHLPATFVACPA